MHTVYGEHAFAVNPLFIIDKCLNIAYVHCSLTHNLP